MMHTIQTADGIFVGVGHFVKNFNTLAVIVDWYPELNGSLKPVLRAYSTAQSKLTGGKWVAEPKFIQGIV
jgi:hypothetical protein